MALTAQRKPSSTGSSDTLEPRAGKGRRSNTLVAADREVNPQEAGLPFRNESLQRMFANRPTGPSLNLENIMGDQKQNPGSTDQEKQRENERAGQQRDQNTDQGQDRDRASNPKEDEERKRNPGTDGGQMDEKKR